MTKLFMLLGTIKTKEEKPYSVFTPFKRRWIENFKVDFLDIEFNYTVKNDSGFVQISMILILNLKNLIQLICLYGRSGEQTHY